MPRPVRTGLQSCNSTVCRQQCEAEGHEVRSSCCEDCSAQCMLERSCSSHTVRGIFMGSWR